MVKLVVFYQQLHFQLVPQVIITFLVADISNSYRLTGFLGFWGFFPSHFMSICNPLDYDRPERFYIHNLARLNAFYLFISALFRYV